MAAASRPIAYRAAWVLPVVADAIRNGCVAVVDDRIDYVGPAPPAGFVEVDLGDAAVAPGFVNAHTHLEFSDCESPLGEAGSGFADWISKVTQYRIRRAEADAEASTRAVAAGLRESLAAGVATIGEIATSAWPAALVDHGPRATAFWEVIALAPERFDEALAKVAAHEARGSTTRHRLGLSPHAPYTVHPDLFARLVDYAVARRWPVAFHLAESRAELKLLATGTGGMVDYLTERGFWRADAIPHGTRPLDYLRQLSQCDRALVVHGNYLADDEIEFIAGHDQLSVVYCPRTHAYFMHERYPLEKLLAAGVNVAMGTDSRASNPDLSLLAELRFVAATFPGVDPAAILRLGTLGGARALGDERQTGSLEPGKRADLVVVSLADAPANNPYEAILRSRAPVTAVMTDGRWRHGPLAP